MSADASFMGRALELASAALGRTAPNPAVGAVVVRDGAVLGEGSTRPVGGDHAEKVALDACKAAGRDPAGATMYVTLEPCCHHGRTPPCTDAVIAAGIARVVVGVTDPFPAVRGRGIRLLRQAGIEVTLGVHEAACAAQVLGFARAVTAGLPEVTLKAAVSVDGHLATASGDSQWITGPEARAVGHRLRARHDAICVGIGTVLADDPRLTTRVPGDPGASDPVAVVFDSHLRCPDDAALLRAERGVLLVCGPSAPERTVLGAAVVRVEVGTDGRVEPVAAMRSLAERGLHRVLVEGGGQVHRSLLDVGVADTLELFVGGVVIAGGQPWVGGPPIATLDQAHRMRIRAVERVGDDVHLSYRLVHALAPDPFAALRSE